MIFSSPVFLLCFLPVVLLLYYLPLRRHRGGQNILLLIFSLLFYAWGEKWFVLVMMGSIVANWLLGLWVGLCKTKGRSSRLPVVAAVVINLALLFVFKYLTFVLTNLNLLGFQFMIPVIELPIGISFFTFQALSYVLDVARGRGETQKNLLHVGLYVSFFPQLIAGPIVKYETIAHEILHRKESWEDFSSGTARFVVGLAKKVLLSNQLALCADRIMNSDPASLPMATAWIGVVAYMLQLYFDFSGYSDMAIGMGRMFGFHFRENFRHPYAATSLADFWARWHISLTTWFRDYLYIPLGGSRVKSKARLLFNLSSVWIFSAIWHGANWTYLVWGILNFAGVMLEKVSGLKDRPPKAIGCLYTNLYFAFTVTIFRQSSVAEGIRYWGALVGLGDGLWNSQSLFFLQENLLLMVIGALCAFPIGAWLSKKAERWGVWGEAGRAVLTLLALTAVTVLMARGSYNPFIYFNF